MAAAIPHPYAGGCLLAMSDALSPYGTMTSLFLDRTSHCDHSHAIDGFSVRGCPYSDRCLFQDRGGQGAYLTVSPFLYCLHNWGLRPLEQILSTPLSRGPVDTRSCHSLAFRSLLASSSRAATSLVERELTTGSIARVACMRLLSHW